LPHCSLAHVQTVYSLPVLCFKYFEVYTTDVSIRGGGGGGMFTF